MNYAKLGPRKSILRCIDTEQFPNADVSDCIELTPQQVATVATIRADKKIPIWFAGRVTCREAEIAPGFRFYWDTAVGDHVKVAIVTPVPQKISAWQAKAALQLTPHPQAGNMLVATEAALAAMPASSEKVVVMAAWNNQANFSRQSATILQFGVVLGMDSDALDALFRLGDSLTV